ncbi:MAG: type III-A CRISPR-associated RAMP protein Csm3 [Bacteroidota bacterium]
MAVLTKKIFFSGSILTLTGIHIGGTNSSMAIGGPDKTVVRNPLDNRPYIPGSSLKGKMRSLIELAEGTITVAQGNPQIKYRPSNDPHTLSGMLFGTASGDTNQRPSRIIVRDGKLLSEAEEFTHTDLPYSETKTEVTIDRVTARANPRQIERVPAGARFELNLVLNVFESDDESRMIQGIWTALELVQDDYLGGNGSRGYGQIQITIDKITEKSAKYYKGGEPERDISLEVEIPGILRKTEASHT